jgi:hypothetical protein
MGSVDGLPRIDRLRIRGAFNDLLSSGLFIERHGVGNASRRLSTMPYDHPLASDDDASVAHLFECGCEPILAVTCDRSGANLPASSCVEGWRFKATFSLGVHEPMPLPISPEPILRGIKSDGYYMWRNGPVRNPSGTSQ